MLAFKRIFPFNIHFFAYFKPFPTNFIKTYFSEEIEPLLASFIYHLIIPLTSND